MLLEYGLIAFAAIFVVVGFLRVVEFKAAGLSSLQIKLLLPLHFLGTVAFAAATVFLAVDEHGAHHALMSWLFYGSVLVLFPIHIFLNIKRRIRISK